MKKFLYTALMGLFCVTLLSSVGCEQVDNATGTNVKAGTADPGGGAAGDVLRTVDGFLPPGWNLLAKIALAGLTLYQTIRLKTTKDQRDSAVDAHDATVAGVKSALIASTSPTASAISDAIYDAHQAAGVDPEHTVAVVNRLEPPK